MRVDMYMYTLGSMASGQKQLALTFNSTSINRVRIIEDQTAGQLVHQYTVNVYENGNWVKASSGQSIGAGKIDIFSTNYTTNQIEIITDSVPRGLTFQVFSCTNPK